MQAGLSVLALSLTLLPPGPPGPPGPPPASPVTLAQMILGPRLPIDMTDQFGNPHQLAELEGNVVVMVYGYPERVQQYRVLAEHIRVHYRPDILRMPPQMGNTAPLRPLPGSQPWLVTPDVQVVVVATIGKVPPCLRKYASRRIALMEPDEPVWLDFENLMRLHFGLQPNLPNFVVFDTYGRLRFVTNGGLIAPQFDELIHVIDTIRRESLPPEELFQGPAALPQP